MSDSIGPRLERLWYSSAPPWRLARAALLPASWAFRATSALRLRLYTRGLLEPERVGVPVVSVGNLSVGGAGKTPFVIWLATALRARGLRPVVVSRGHGSGSRDPAIISTPSHPPVEGKAARGPEAHRVRQVRADGSGWHPNDAHRHVGEEALLTALRSGCPVVTARDRALACRLAVERLAAGLIVLDDGFQRIGLHRDLDVVLLPATDEGARVLPAGPLREPPARLSRAHVVLRDAMDANPRVGIRRRVVGVVGAVTERAEAADRLRGRTAVAVAGIARPERFFGSLRELGVDVRHALRFPDHHRYGPEDWAEIASVLGASDFLLTTEKDLITLRDVVPGDRPLLALRIEIEVDGADALLERIKKLDAHQRAAHDR
jgi:tetraacyldisaccharide 4'-kinase